MLHEFAETCQLLDLTSGLNDAGFLTPRETVEPKLIRALGGASRDVSLSDFPSDKHAPARGPLGLSPRVYTGAAATLDCDAPDADGRFTFECVETDREAPKVRA